jgi:diacylglycerol kinase (ATP)
MKISIIANPVSGGGRAFEKIHRYLNNWNHPGWEVDLLTTKRRGHAGLLARGLFGSPPDVLAVCGGDGTLNEIASQIPDAPFPIAIIPAGTANVVARELRLPLDPVKALKICLNRKIRKADLGNLGPGTRRRFLFVAGIGFDAYVASSVPAGLKSIIGIGAYAYALVRCLQNYSFPVFQVVAGDKTYTATSCLACNSRSYGGELLFCRDANMFDGLLDILVMEGRSRLKLAKFLLSARLQRTETGEGIHRFRANSLRLEGPPGVCVQADGEIIDGLPLEISLARSAFPLIVP